MVLTADSVAGTLVGVAALLVVSAVTTLLLARSQKSKPDGHTVAAS